MKAKKQSLEDVIVNYFLKFRSGKKKAPVQISDPSVAKMIASDLVRAIKEAAQKARS